MTKKKIFITGISSNIMLRLVKQIDLKQYEIVGLSRAPSRMPSVNFRVIKGDILNLNALDIDFSAYDMIIHAAAITHAFDTEKYYDINLKATQALVDLTKSNQALKFVFISSRTASEESGAYGISKLRAEEYIQKHLDNWLIFRPAEVYGASKQEGIEALIRDTIRKPYALCPVQVKSKMYPIFVDDLIAVIFNKIFVEKLHSQIITINGNDGYSFKEVIQLTARLAHKRIWIVPLPKWLMMVIKKTVAILPFSIGILPDQIDRLYSKKEVNGAQGNFRNFENYVIEVVEGSGY